MAISGGQPTARASYEQSFKTNTTSKLLIGPLSVVERVQSHAALLLAGTEPACHAYSLPTLDQEETLVFP